MHQTIAARSRADLLAKIDAFLASEGMSESAFGLAAASDVKIVRRIRSGQNVTLATIERLEKWIAERTDARKAA